MSVVIDTSNFDCELESEEYLFESSTELDATQEAEGEFEEADHETEPETETALAEINPPDDPPHTFIQRPDDSDDRDDFRTSIWNAEMRCRGKEAIVEDLKEQLKFAKADYEDSIAALRKLANWGNEPVHSISVQPAISEPDKVDPEEVKAIEQEPEPDESWRANSLIELLKSSEISGMGDKKLDSLADICKTFGDFEDLRTKASLEGVHLKEVLPSGFGEKITDQIEEVYFAAINNPLSRSEQSYNQKPEDLEDKPEELAAKSEELTQPEFVTTNLDDL